MMRIKFLAILSASLVTLFLIWQAVVPGGLITYETDFSQPDFFIEKFTPSDRLGEADGGQIITGEPVYFSLRTPRKFNKATITVHYKNESEYPIVEMGVLKDAKIWRYEKRPLMNMTIDKLALVWDKIDKDGVVLLQKEMKYLNIEDFLENIPPVSKVAVYNYDLPNDYIMPDYEKGKRYAIDQSLRGDYQFYVYLKDEDLNLEFSFLDINKNKDPDPIDVFLYYQGSLIDSRHLEGDGVSADSGKTNEVGKIDLKVPNLPEGAYKVEVRANDDIITEEIKSEQYKLAFINKIWLNDSGAEDIVVYTDAPELRLQTVSPSSLQTVKVGSESVELRETYKQYSIKNKESIGEVALEKDGVIIAGSGMFSFGKKSFFDPEYEKIEVGQEILPEGIDYVIAGYQPPVMDGEWLTSKIEFDLSGAYREKITHQLGDAGRYSFLIAVPGLRADDGVDDRLVIKDMKIELEGQSLWNKLKSVF